MPFTIRRHAMQNYPESLAEQEAAVEAVLNGASPLIIFTEHPPIYTVGTSGSMKDVLTTRFANTTIQVYETGRGGKVTYHGPGQLMCYVIADLRLERDLRLHVWRLEEMAIRALADFGIQGHRSRKGIGVWTSDGKIASIGVRCRRWVTYHGMAINRDPNLTHFSGIVPCGLAGEKVTSMAKLGANVPRIELEEALAAHADSLFRC